MQTSSPARPCPCCGRTRDSDCRWNDTTILCHQGQSHGPPSHLKRGDTINIGGKQWAVIRFDGGFAGCAMVLKPHRGKARSRAYSRLLGATAPPMDKVGRLAADEIEKAIADIDRALAVPPFEFLRPDEMRRDFALALETYEATNAFRKTVGKLGPLAALPTGKKSCPRPCVENAVVDVQSGGGVPPQRAGRVQPVRRTNRLQTVQGDRTWMTPESF